MYPNIPSTSSVWRPMLKGWERLKLPVNLENQPPRTPPQGTQNGPTPPGNTPFSAPVPPGSQPVSASPEAARARQLLEMVFDAQVQHLNSMLPVNMWFGGSLPDDPAYAAKVIDELNTPNKATTIVKKSGIVPDPLMMTRTLRLNILPNAFGLGISTTNFSFERPVQYRQLNNFTQPRESNK
jgi:hypothetical protein